MSLTVVCTQVLVLFLLMGVGYFAGKTGMIGDECVRQVTGLLLYIVSPCVIIVSFQIKYTPQLAEGLLISAACAAGIHIFAILIGKIVFHKKWPEAYRNILKFAVTYSNCGFIGLPMLQAVVGQKGLFYGSVYIAVFNLFAWTHGISLFRVESSGENRRFRKDYLKKAVLNPNLVAVAIGIFLFAFSLRLVQPVYNTMYAIYGLNTPLSMIVIGTRMTRLDFKKVFLNRYVWPGVLMRNFLIPFCFLIAMRLAGLRGILMTSCLIQSACPVAGNTVLFAELYNRDTEFPSELMSVSTLFSILSIPFILCLIPLFQ